MSSLSSLPVQSLRRDSYHLSSYKQYFVINLTVQLALLKHNTNKIWKQTFPQSKRTLLLLQGNRDLGCFFPPSWTVFQSVVLGEMCWVWIWETQIQVPNNYEMHEIPESTFFIFLLILLTQLLLSMLTTLRRNWMPHMTQLPYLNVK